MSSADIENLVDSYCRAWFDPDPDERRRLMARSFETDGVYVDPAVHLFGIEALLTHIEKVIAARPGFWLRRTSVIDGHHDLIRFGWVRMAGDEVDGEESIDVCRISPDGRFSLVAGFFGPLRPSTEPEAP